jgi:uncharacterized protein YxeA
MKKAISLLAVVVVVLGIVLSCSKNDIDQQYQTYEVEYLLKNNLPEGKRFTITYKNPAYANKTTEQYENIQDTFWIRFEAKSLDYLYLSAKTKNDTSDYSISIYVDSKLIEMDSTSCNWECDSTFVEIDYPLP